MKAIFFEEHGDINVLKYADLPDPEPKSGEALIRVKAVALNHLDIWVRRGWKGLRLKMPHISGSDIAGEIVSVSSRNSSWTPGTRVVVNPGVNTAQDEWTRKGENSISPGYRIIGEQLPGGLAEYVTVPVKNVYKIPQEISFEHAAAPLLVGTTCWRMLLKRAQLKPGNSVLIVGSGGGVNSFSILLAKAFGATVYVLCGTQEKIRRSEQLGADYCIDYSKNDNWPLEILQLTKGRGVDIVIDNVGSKTFHKSLRSLARGGKIVTVGNTSGHELRFDNRLVFTKQISILGSTMGSEQDFIDVMKFIWHNKIEPVVDTVEPLKNGIKMIKRLEDGKQFGKIVLTT